MITFVKSAKYQDSYPKELNKQVVVVGRSNAGKSSFINSFFQSKVAHTGKKPGKTRMINFFDVDNSYYLVDLPGYGYANVSKAMLVEFGKMMEAYFKDNNDLKLMLFIMDIRRVPNQDDLLMLKYAIDLGIPYLIIANKADKLNQREISKNLKVITETLEVDKEIVIPYSCLKNNYRNYALNIYKKYI